MPSRTELFLPFIRTEFLESFLKSGEAPLFDIEGILEKFADKLRSDTVPDEWLNWLFYALGGDGYLRDDFSDTRKRNTLKRIFSLYTGRGTLEGLDLHWQLLADHKILTAHQPPAKSFMGTSLTNEERRKFEALHPEIRVFEFKGGGKKQSFFTRDCLGDPSENHSIFPYKTDALLRVGDQVELYDPLTNETTRLNFFRIEREQIERKSENRVEVRLKGQAKGIFFSRFVAGHTVNQNAGSRFYNIQLEKKYETEIEKRIPLSITPSLTPFRAFYEEERTPGFGRGFFLANRYPDLYPDRGGSFVGQFPVNHKAGERIYKRLRLFDPNRASLFKRSAFLFLGAFRLGSLKPHHAEVYLDMVKAKPRHILFSSGFAGGFYATGDAGERIERMRWAGNLARRAGGKILVGTRNRKPVRVGSRIIAGQYKAGEYQLEVI